jgi:hypothetical protein
LIGRDVAGGFFRGASVHLRLEPGQLLFQQRVELGVTAIFLFQLLQVLLQTLPLLLQPPVLAFELTDQCAIDALADLKARRQFGVLLLSLLEFLIKRLPRQ